MELSESDFKHDSEDIIGLALAQAFGLVMTGLAVLVIATNYVGVAAEYGREFKVPYAAALGPALGLFALACTAALPGRYSNVWSEPRARRRIILGLAQAIVFAAVVALVSFVLAGSRVDLLTPGQMIEAWLFNSLFVGSCAQAAVCLGAFVLLMLKREMP